jgi:hypothetical protein
VFQRLVVLTATVAAVAALSGPASAQSRIHTSHGGWVSQYDRPGDYRCDAYWDANRRDCDAGWRDQRRFGSRGYVGETYGYRYGQGHDRYRPDGPDVYPGAWGRPDLVYPGHSRADGGRHGDRIAWCRATYRSYDPRSGYYRTYDGRQVFCG